MLADAIDQLYRNAANNLVWLATWSALSLFLIVLVWWWVPALVARALRWLDDLLPGDFSLLYRPLGRSAAALLSLGILVVTAIAVTSGLQGNVGAAQALLGETARGIGRWSLEHLPKIVAVVLAASFAQRLASHAIPRAVARHLRARATDELESEVEKNITTLSSVLAKATTIVIFSATLFMVMAQVGVDLGPLLVAAGVVGIAVGFGAQNLIRDIFAGIFIILENQYRVGDVVEVAGIGGLVEDINLRRTVLRDLDYRQHFIPNGEIRTASNFTKGKSRVNLNISVAYKEDLDRVIQVLNEVGQELAQDPEWASIILDPLKVLRVDNFGESGIDIKVLGEVVPIRQWDVAGQYRLRVKRAFDRLGIEIPFPHRTLYWGTGEPNVLAMAQIREEQRTASKGDDSRPRAEEDRRASSQEKDHSLPDEQMP